MIEGPEVEAHLHHKTGHSLADKILAFLAIFLSCVSVFIAVSHGRTMERLVAANSWPNLGFSTGNTSDDGTRDQISLNIKNTGVGPARIDSFELFYKGVPEASAKDLAKACCEVTHAYLNISTVMDEVLPARDTLPFLIADKDKNDAAFWDKLNVERLQIRARVCYCSVFEECWVRDSEQRRPERVNECHPTQPIQYK